MRKGERNQADSADDPAPLLGALTRLRGLIGALDAPEWRVRVAVALALTLVSKVLIVWAPLILADAINLMAAHAGGVSPAAAALPSGLLAGLVAWWAAVRFLGSAAPQLRDAIFQPVSEEAQRRAGTATFAHVHALGVGFHLSRRAGALWRTIERGVRSIDFLVRFVAFNIGPTLVELVLAAVVLGWRYGPVFAAIAAGTVLVYALATIAVTEWRLRYRREMNAADSEATGRAVDSLVNFETVKAFAAEARETARYDQALRAYARASARSVTTLQALNAAQGLVQNLGLAVMVVAAAMAMTGGLDAAGRRLGPGDVAALILVMMNLYAPLNVLGFAWREIKQGAIDLEAMFALLDEPLETADAPDAAPLRVSAGEIRFEGVGFVHDGRSDGLSDVDFVAPAGGMTALVGPSGSGKSTLARLLLRFHDPRAGAVRIDGQDLRGVTMSSLRAAIGLVPQDVALFNDTLAYNIAYGRPDATPEAILEAARLARLDTLIAAAPLGLETRVGERGLKLSGGERQRVGIARAILKNPPILILDEATSSLDSATEADVRAALEAAAAGRTVLVIAHRLSTIVDADLILVVEDGAIVARGTHGQLMAAGGLYADLWERQARMGAA